MTDPVRIDRLGARGDGVADRPDGPVYVPFTLPGEVVRPGRDVAEIVEASADRVAPVCRHFGTCGGCALQHLDPAATARWKRELVTTALRTKGLDGEIAETVTVPVAARRRAVLALARRGKATLLGFRTRASHDIVDLAECPVLVPEIASALPALRAVLAPLAPYAGGKGRRGGAATTVSVLSTASGLDVAVDRPKAKPLDATTLAALARNAGNAGWARLTVDGETIAAFREPVLEIGPARVVPPPGGFVQAAFEAEAALAEIVCAALGETRRVADLYAGIGTFALRLAAASAVHAVESSDDALAALDAAARRTPGLKPVTVERRDLDRAPLTAAELKSFDGLVFDPPRAGAAAQVRELALSRIPVIAAVSCNPSTFARDARTLVDGGYRLDAVTAVDQFRFAAHVECVAVFRC